MGSADTPTVGWTALTVPSPRGAPGPPRGPASASVVAATAAARLKMASLVGPRDRMTERLVFGLAFATRFFHLAEPAQIVRWGLDILTEEEGGGGQEEGVLLSRLAWRRVGAANGLWRFVEVWVVHCKYRRGV